MKAQETGGMRDRSTRLPRMFKGLPSGEKEWLIPWLTIFGDVNRSVCAKVGARLNTVLCTGIVPADCKDYRSKSPKREDAYCCETGPFTCAKILACQDIEWEMAT